MRFPELTGRGIKRVFDMFQPVAFFFPNQQNQIETDGPGYVEQTRIRIGGSDGPFDFSPIDGRCRFHPIIFRTGFHFHYHQFIRSSRYNIQLVMVPMPIGVQKGISLSGKVLASEVFSFGSDFIMYGHLVRFVQIYVFSFLFALSRVHLYPMKQERKYSSAQPNHPRVHKVTFMLNDEEHKAVKRYLSRYKIVNKSRWYRETILSHILKTLEEDYPTLFNENEMRR